MADSPNRFGSLAQLLNRKREDSYGGENALTAVEKSGGKPATDYLKSNEGYAQIVGVKIGDSPKVYDYIDPSGTSRAGDSPTVEVTNKFSGRNTFVPGKHTKVVRTGKGGIAKNEGILDKMTNKGINLKTIQRQATLREEAGLKTSGQTSSNNNMAENNQKGGQ